MAKLKYLCAAMALALGATQTLEAKSSSEKDYESYPYMFLGLHGGAQATFSDFKTSKLITPVYGLSFGSYFTPAVGARLHVSGFQNKGGINSLDQTYDYKYVTTDIDLLLNLTNLFSKTDDHIFNVVLFGGIGLNYAWDNDDFTALSTTGKVSYPQAWKDNLLSHNARVGVQFDFNIAKHFGMNLELAANHLSDRYNSKVHGGGDWQGTATVGLTYKFGFKKKKAQPAPVVEEQWATRVDTVWYDDISYKDVPVQEKLESQIYYQISMSEPQPQAKIQEIVNFVKNHKNCKINITSYADKGTGNPTINMKYSQQRTQNVIDALVKAGIDKNTITAESKGDTVQPFQENDKNRVSITVVTGDGVKKEKVVTKKFRTEEVRYQVK